jgi:hypothetical protein
MESKTINIKLIEKVICCFVALLLCNTNLFSQNKDTETYGYHAVEAGENLYRISQTYFLKESDITDINPGLSAENLKAGQRIKIPLTVRNKALLQQGKKGENSTHSKSNSNTKSSSKKNIKKGYEKNKHLNIAMFLPLNYDKLNELTFNKFNINDKRSQEYKCFEYIGFYEGARIALDKLEAEGYNVSLYVYDVNDNNVEAMQAALASEEMKSMDLLLPLVLQQPFTICANYAQSHKIPIVNPMSTNLSILNNSEVFKIQPSPAAEVETIIRYIRSNFDKPNITLIHSNTAEEKPIIEYYQKIFEKGSIPWVIIDYNRFASRINEKITKDKQNIVISTVKKKDDKENESYLKELLNKLNSNKASKIYLFGPYSWLNYNSTDYSLFDKFNFHFSLSYLNDYSNANFVNFVKQYRDNFKGEPSKIYAALGYDILLYFVPTLIEKGDDFIDDPNSNLSKGMVNTFYFERRDDKSGYQNKRTVIYRVSDYKIVPVGR